MTDTLTDTATISAAHTTNVSPAESNGSNWLIAPIIIPDPPAFIDQIVGTVLRLMHENDVVREATANVSGDAVGAVLRALLGHSGWGSNRVWTCQEYVAQLSRLCTKTVGRVMAALQKMRVLREVRGQELLNGPGAHRYQGERVSEHPVKHWDMSGLLPLISAKFHAALEMILDGRLEALARRVQQQMDFTAPPPATKTVQGVLPFVEEKTPFLEAVIQEKERTDPEYREFVHQVDYAFEPAETPTAVKAAPVSAELPLEKHRHPTVPTNSTQSYSVKSVSKPVRGDAAPDKSRSEASKRPQSGSLAKPFSQTELSHRRYRTQPAPETVNQGEQASNEKTATKQAKRTKTPGYEALRAFGVSRHISRKIIDSAGEQWALDWTLCARLSQTPVMSGGWFYTAWSTPWELPEWFDRRQEREASHQVRIVTASSNAPNAPNTPNARKETPTATIDAGDLAARQVVTPIRTTPPEEVQPHPGLIDLSPDELAAVESRALADVLARTPAILHGTIHKQGTAHRQVQQRVREILASETQSN